MAHEPEKMHEPSQTAGHALRKLAADQGAAYRAYGQALERFGSGEINAGELFRFVGDLYFKEAGRAASGLFNAIAEGVSRGLSSAGVQVLDLAENRNGKAQDAAAIRPARTK
jgi:hypothetical protein